MGDLTPDGSMLANRIRSELDLLGRHVSLLKAVMEHEPIGIIRLSDKLGYPQHKVRYTLRVLEQEGLIEPTPEGAVTTEKTGPFLGELRALLDEMGDVVGSLKSSI